MNTMQDKTFIGYTLVDITPTGVTRDLGDKELERNQQRNWETLLQIISLRTQPIDLTVPEKKDTAWEFEFRSESEGVFEMHGNPDPLAGLKQDCEGVPMMLNLTEQPSMTPTIATSGDNQNIWFITVNNTLE